MKFNHLYFIYFNNKELKPNLLYSRKLVVRNQSNSIKDSLRLNIQIIHENCPNPIIFSVSHNTTNRFICSYHYIIPQNIASELYRKSYDLTRRISLKVAKITFNFRWVI